MLADASVRLAAIGADRARRDAVGCVNAHGDAIGCVKACSASGPTAPASATSTPFSKQCPQVAGFRASEPWAVTDVWCEARKLGSQHF
eukprot:1541240-Alexandrium_andersonii.AAC.1